MKYLFIMALAYYATIGLIMLFGKGKKKETEDLKESQQFVNNFRLANNNQSSAPKLNRGAPNENEVIDLKVSAGKSFDIAEKSNTDLGLIKNEKEMEEKNIRNDDLNNEKEKNVQVGEEPIDLITNILQKRNSQSNSNFAKMFDSDVFDELNSMTPLVTDTGEDPISYSPELYEKEDLIDNLSGYVEDSNGVEVEDVLTNGVEIETSPVDEIEENDAELNNSVFDSF